MSHLQKDPRTFLDRKLPVPDKGTLKILWDALLWQLPNWKQSYYVYMVHGVN